MKKLGENIIYLLLNSISISIIGFIFWFLLLKFIAPEDYGIVSYIYSTSILLLGFFSFGIFWSIWKYCSENQFYKVSFFSIILSLLMISMIFLVSQILLKNIYIFIFAFAMFLSSYFENILFGYQEIKKIFIANFLSSILKIVFLLILVSLYKSLSIEVAILIATSQLFIASVLKLYFSKRIILENFKPEIDFKNIKRFFYLAFSNFISSFSSSFFPNILVISSFWIFSSIIAGVMFFSQLISATISFLVAPIVNASLPIISNLAYKKRDEDAKRIIQILFRISLVISITLIFPITFHLKTILEFLNLKQEFINYSPTFFLVISISSLFFLISGILYSFLFSINRIKEIYLIEIFCILLFITLLIFISLNSNVLLFLLSYLFISFLRFFLYSLSLKSLFKSAPEKFNIKLSFLILFSFFISYTLTSKIFLIDISLLILSFILIIFIIKKIKIFEKKEKTFIQKLNLPEFMKKIIFKLI